MYHFDEHCLTNPNLLPKSESFLRNLGGRGKRAIKERVNTFIRGNSIYWANQTTYSFKVSLSAIKKNLIRFVSKLFCYFLKLFSSQRKSLHFLDTMTEGFKSICWPLTVKALFWTLKPNMARTAQNIAKIFL